MSHPARQVLTIQWLSNEHIDPIIAIPVEPPKILVNFLIDTGTQMSVITHETAQTLSITPGQHRVKFTGINGVEKQCPTAKISLWLPEEQKLTRVEVLVGAAYTNILGFDILHGCMWKLPDGTVWSFATHQRDSGTMRLSLLQTSIPSSPAKIINDRQYLLSAAALMGIDGVVTELEKRDIIKRTHSPYNSPVWPVKKPTRQWHFTVEYRQLNANTIPLTAAVPNMAEIVKALCVSNSSNSANYSQIFLCMGNQRLLFHPLSNPAG